MPGREEIGCSTCCLMNRPLEEALNRISLHTNLVEILSDGIHSLFFTEEICYSFNLRYTVHAPCADINIASENERLRKAAIRVIDDLAAICDRIGAERMVIHPGHIWGEEMRKAAEKALYRSLIDLRNLQEDRNVRLTIENMGSWDSYLFREPALLDRLADLDLGFTLDVGHAHVNGLLETFLERGGAIHAHLHDNQGYSDDHLACGEGSIDFKAVMRSLPANATKVVESMELQHYLMSIEHLTSFVG